MNIKTSELTGAALDWAVAKCEGAINGNDLDIGFILEGGYSPSTDWAQGGPIIEREKICVDVGHDGVWLACIRQNYGDLGEHMHASGSPLIAAMRCFVASKLGDEVEIPEELT